MLHRWHALPGGWVNRRVASWLQGQATAPTSLHQPVPLHQPLTTPYHPLPPSHHPPGCKATECWEEALLRKHTAGGADAEAIGDFMLILCCCHTVIPEEVDGGIQYQAPYYGYTC